MSPIRRSIDALKRDLASVRHKGSFARNAMYSMGDAAVNIGTQIILTPIVAHIYGPVGYGIYGLFITISNNIANLGGMGYPSAFVLPKDHSRFLALVRLAFGLLVGLVVLSLPLFLFPALLYRLIPSWSVMGPWCRLIPWMALVVGASQMMAIWNMREKAFSTNAKVNSFSNVTQRLVNLAAGVLTHGAHWGLIFGDALVRTVAMVFYAIGLRKRGMADLFRPELRASARSVAVEYKAYPLFNLPSTWMNLFALQLPIFALSSLGDNRATGCFTLAGSLLLMPLRLFGYSLSSVFIQKATDLNNDPPAMRELVRRMYVRLRMLGLVPFVSLIFFGDVVFDMILGPEWALAGAYCGLMGPFYLFRLLSEPIISIYIAQRKEKALFKFNMLLFALNAAAMGVGTWYFASAWITVLLFAIVNAIAYVFQSAAILARTGNEYLRTTLRTLVAAAIVALILAVLRFFTVGTWWPSDL